MRKLVLLFCLFVFANCSKENVNPPADSNEQEEEEEVSVEIFASDDYVKTSEDSAVNSGNVMDNDTFPDGSSIHSYDKASLNGAEIIDNRDGSFTYTPENSFAGEDSFSYTICDADKIANCSTANVLFLLRTRVILLPLTTTSMLCSIRP